jgi:hypothetical protein
LQCKYWLVESTKFIKLMQFLSCPEEFSIPSTPFMCYHLHSHFSKSNFTMSMYLFSHVNACFQFVEISEICLCKAILINLMTIEIGCILMVMCFVKKSYYIFAMLPFLVKIIYFYCKLIFCTF